MKIIAHRGFWLEKAEKNSKAAFQRAIDGGFGIETDFRDSNGELVISHDPATGGEQGMEEFLDQVSGSKVPLAMNVKADGLVEKMGEINSAYKYEDMVFFDMSGPEHLLYRKQGLRTLNRVSEFESGHNFETPDFGIWLDAFFTDAWRLDWLRKHLEKTITYLVSPELHNRQHLDFWKELRNFEDLEKLTLCTDFPLEAKKFFGGEFD